MEFNVKVIGIARLLIIPAASIVIFGCQRHVEPTATEKASLTQKSLSYCRQGSDALAKNDIATAQKMFLLASQQPGGENLVQTARALEGLAFIETGERKLDPAAEHFQRAIAIYETQPMGKSNTLLVRPLTSLATVYRLQNRPGNSEAVLARAVQIGTPNGPGVDYCSYTRSLQDLGAIYLSENKLLEAESLLRRLLDLKKREPNPNQQQIASIVNNLAVVLEKEGRRQDAQALRSSQTTM